MKHTGEIVRWVHDRGFGFISPSTGGDEVFCHLCQLESVFQPDEGQWVEFEIGKSPRTGKPEAKAVRILDRHASDQERAWASRTTKPVRPEDVAY